MARQRRELDDQLADILTMARGARTNSMTTPAMVPVGSDMIEDNAILNEHLSEGAVRLANLDTELTQTLADLAANEVELKEATGRLEEAESRLDDAFETITVLPSQLEQLEIDARAAATDMSKVLFQSSKPQVRVGSEKDLWINTGDGNSPYRYDLTKKDWVKATDTAALEMAKTQANDLVLATKTQILTAQDIAVEAARVDAIAAAVTAAAADAKSQAEAAEARAAVTAAADAKKKADAAQAAALAAAKTYAEAEASGAGADALAKAKADATAKANAAEAAAVTAAATDATAKKEQAEANAAADAKLKADAALVAAKADAKTKADAALAAAKVDATTKADAAQAAAVAAADTAAKATAKSEAEAAEARAAVTAAADAKAKADAAQAAALAAAKTYSEAQASGAGTAALDAAKADATAKSNAAKIAAVAAAALDATAKKEEAEANAALDAKTKADKALADAKTDAATKANNAKAAAIAAAAADATTKADAAKAAAITAADTAAKATATAAAEAAEARAATAAATIAQTKADAAQAAALAAAKTYADAEASGAGADALAKAKADATTKANAAKAAAISAAATDATAKKEQAEANAAADAQKKATDALTAAKKDAQEKADAALEAAKESASKLAANMMPMGDFETGTLAQLFPSNATNKLERWQVVTGANPMGKRFLRYTHDAAADASVSQGTIPVLAGHTYRFGVWARIFSGTLKSSTQGIGWPHNWRTPTLGVSNSNWPKLFYPDDFTKKLTSEWQYITADATVPAGIDFLVPRFYAYAASANTGLVLDFAGIDMRDVTDILTTQKEVEAFTVEKINDVANSKNATFYSTSAPSNTASPGTLAGDTWRRKDSSGNIIGEWEWSGSAWTQRKMTSASMTAIDVGVLTAGSATISSAVAAKIAAGTATIQKADIGNLTVTGTTNMATAVAQRMAANVGTFIELNASQLTASNAALDQAVVNKFYGEVVESRLMKGEQIEAGSIRTRHLKAVGQNLLPDPYFVDASMNAERLAASTLPAGASSFVADDVTTSNVFRFTEHSDTYRSLNISGAAADARIPARTGDVFKFKVMYRTRGNAVADAAATGVRFAIYHDSPKGAYIRYVGVGSYQTIKTSGANWYVHESEYKITQADVGFIRPQLQFRNPGLSGELELKHPSVMNATTAGTLESDLVLASRVIAGDPDGTRAEMSPSGFRVFAANQAGDGASEVVRMGVAETDDYFAVTKADGTLAATISQDGAVSARAVSADETLYYKGEELTDIIDRLPRGVIAMATRSTSSPEYDAAKMYPYLHVTFPVENGRLYRISTNPINIEGNGSALSQIHWAQNEAATTAHNSLTRVYTAPSSMGAAWNTPMVHNRVFRCWWTGTLSLLLAVRGIGSTRIKILGDGGYMLNHIIAEDIGILPQDTGEAQDGTAATKPPTRQNYTKEWTANAIRNYQGSGSVYAINNGKIYQGLSPAGYGNLTSVATFPDMTSTLSGATINSVSVYLYAEHWYYNSGGTVRLGLTGKSLPSTNKPTGVAATSTGWPKPGGRWVNIPSSYFAGIKSGTYGGISLNGDSTYNTYGYFSGNPKIKINYTK